MLINQMVISESQISNSNLEPKGIILNIIQFISKYLPDFKINQHQINTKRKEESYNNQLSMFFNAKCSNEVFQFQHEFKRTNSRIPDIGVLIRALIMEGNYESIFDIECKRLNTDLIYRKEYVCGETGGIERFKRNLHGCYLKYSAIIGYIEDETVDFWISEINRWISDLHSGDSTFWNDDEYLIPNDYGRYHSKHKRIAIELNDSIALYHFFYHIS